MSYASLRECVIDLERTGQLVRIKEEVDPDLEMAEIHRQVYGAGGPAILFERVKGSPFQAVSNLFGTVERSRFMFRDSLRQMEMLVKLKVDPMQALKHPFRHASLLPVLPKALPRKRRSGPVMFGETKISQLPQVKSWPDDGGAFVTLPLVYSEDPSNPGPMKSNLGMYRVQMSGNQYQTDKQIGLHYQLHRGIGVHHTLHKEMGKPMNVSVFVGGPPSHIFSAVMPLPEGLAEVMFAGMLGRRPFRYANWNGYTLDLDADFCIVGTIEENTLPEGPFGDHLGYYSLAHDFPVLKVEKVFHRKDPLWAFTVVGRPPQEDTSFGHLIHEITGPVVPSEIPGLQAMHAVDAAGVHPLLLAIGSERYQPWMERKPREILTIANHILGFNQASLAKYLFIVAGNDDPALDIHDIPAFLRHLLERINPETDLHFQTNTTIDTLDYSGTALNEGSKVVLAAAGEKKRELGTGLPMTIKFMDVFRGITVVMPGILAIQGPKYEDAEQGERTARQLAKSIEENGGFEKFPLIVLVDDNHFTARTLNNFLWVTFTRSNPSHDIYGVGEFIRHKHWGCTGPIIIDARIKPHHAPPLIEDPAVVAKLKALAAQGKSLHGII